MPFNSSRQHLHSFVAALILSPAALSTPSQAKDLARTHSCYVPMRDQLRLAVDVHLPLQDKGPSCFPVLLEYTPYQRSTVDPKTGAVNDITESARGLLLLPGGCGA